MTPSGQSKYALCRLSMAVPRPETQKTDDSQKKTKLSWDFRSINWRSGKMTWRSSLSFYLAAVVV